MSSGLVDSADSTRMSDNTAMDVDQERNQNNDHNENEEDDDDGEDDDDDDSSEEEEIVPKILPKRSTRGTRLTDMHAGEGDDEFWNQEFFADEPEEDNDYEKSDADKDEEPDEYDSDFFESESESDDEEVEVDKEKRGKKAGSYVDPKHLAAKRAAAAKKAAATKARTKAAQQAAAAAAASAVERTEDGKIDTGAVPPVTVFYDEDGFPTGQDRLIKRKPTSLLLHPAYGRKSVRQTTIEASLETHRKEEEKAKKRKENKPKAKVPIKHLTQDELLKQSLETEKENIESLAQLLKLEEEKKKEIAPKPKQLGDCIQWKSFIIKEANAPTGQQPTNDKVCKLLSFTMKETPEYLQPEIPQRQSNNGSANIRGVSQHCLDQPEISSYNLFCIRVLFSVVSLPS